MMNEEGRHYTFDTTYAHDTSKIPKMLMKDSRYYHSSLERL